MDTGLWRIRFSFTRASVWFLNNVDVARFGCGLWISIHLQLLPKWFDLKKAPKCLAAPRVIFRNLSFGNLVWYEGKTSKVRGVSYLYVSEKVSTRVILMNWLHTYRNKQEHTHMPMERHMHSNIMLHCSMFHCICHSWDRAYLLISFHPPICISGLYDSPFGNPFCVCVFVYVRVCVHSQVLQYVKGSSTLSLRHTPLCSSHDPFNFLCALLTHSRYPWQHMPQNVPQWRECVLKGTCVIICYSLACIQMCVLMHVCRLLTCARKWVFLWIHWHWHEY